VSALRGLRVLELAGPFTAVGGRLLAELGADVLVVEPPRGSPERHRPPFVRDQPGVDRSLRWWAGNVGKRSATVDLDDPVDLERLRRLIEAADVVVEGMGRDLDARGLGWDAIGPEHEGLIWVSITPFGRESARHADPVTDLTMLAGSGPLWNCGYDDHTVPPIRGTGGQASNVAGHYVAMGALVALAHRDRTGRGQLVDVNLTAALNVSSEQVTYNWLVIGEICTRQTGRHAYYVPTAPVQVRCADGAYATTGVLPRHPAEFGQLHAWLHELGVAEQLPEAVFLELASQREGALDLAEIGIDEEVTAMLGAAREAIALIAANLPAKEFFLQSQRRGFPAGAVLTPDEAFEDEHFEARGFPVAVDHPELEDTFRYPGVPYRFSASPPTPPRRPPTLGEHDPLVAEGAWS
jgi:crotonobetainyl-CoA:carnitine CoA-transferase CaiB-like acyl-CoA transferase